MHRVAIIGNGPVGQTAALLLARWGVPSVVLDGRPHRDPIGSKAICQQRDVLDIWEAASGAGQRIAAEGLTWTTARTLYRDRELFSYDLVDRGRSHFPAFVNLSQTRTEQILDEHILSEDLIDVKWGHEVTGVTQEDNGVSLSCTTVDGNPATIEAEYVIACAGARGDAIRNAVGVTFDGESFDDRFLICDIKADLPGWSNERRFYFDPAWNPGRQILIHPCPDSTYRIDWQVPGDYDLELEESSGALDARIRAVIGDQPYEIVWKSVYRFHSRLVDRMRVGRILLAGDCAHLVSPFGARGLNSGVTDAENAAWKLAFVLNGWAPEALLDTYHDERHAAALENIHVTTDTMNFLVPRDDDRRRKRAETLDAAVVDPGMSSEVDSGRLAEPFWYTDSPLTTADSRRPFGGRPLRGTVPPAGPGVLVPDVPVSVGNSLHSRLRELARDGFLVLVAPGNEFAPVREAAVTAVTAPVRVLETSELDVCDALRDALDLRPGDVWVIRPDAHVAAVLDRPETAEVVAALRRAVHHSTVDHVAPLAN
ncbi:FAD-dependent monooxygenase [Nocardia sp. SYP-A9097]|uniref:FAD-dependent monooxygenase n=1 Tax=Nocardia sp. SYP-A9097 TaxID=2663237 RepID=UPI002105480B|nr:FAD-dependent monooxygenase [Nocardia sp. SYP-A9097]